MTQHRRDVGAVPVSQAASVTVPSGPRPAVVLSLSGHLPPATNVPPKVFAPAGRLLRCQLVNTLESIRIDTPVIGLVTEDLWFNRRLIVPAGTELHGKAQVDRVRDRLDATGAWTLVFPHGEELVVHGLVLHRDEAPDGQHWGPDDGSAGFKGQVLKGASWDEIKLFAATFLAGLSRGLQDTDTTMFGPQTRRSVRNATVSGAGTVLDEYARAIAGTIQRDGIYVRVPAGARFYLYVPQTLYRAAARVGATRR
jgi:hypothetical protein